MLFLEKDLFWGFSETFERSKTGPRWVSEFLNRFPRCAKVSRTRHKNLGPSKNSISKMKHNSWNIRGSFFYIGKKSSFLYRKKMLFLEKDLFWGFSQLLRGQKPVSQVFWISKSVSQLSQSLTNTSERKKKIQEPVFTFSNNFQKNLVFDQKTRFLPYFSHILDPSSLPAGAVQDPKMGQMHAVGQKMIPKHHVAWP